MGLRGMGLWAGWILGLAGCAAGWPLPVTAPRVMRVDARGLPGGDGGPDRPFQTLVEAVAAAGQGDVEIRVASGEYPGGFPLRPGMRVVGGGAVLVHDAAACVVRAAGGLLENVMVQGGEVGVCAEGPVLLRSVVLSGQRRAAVQVAPGAVLDAEGLQVEATLPDITGVELQPGGRARLSEARFDGPFQKAVSSRQAELAVSRSAFHDARTAVHAVGGKVVLDQLYAGGGRGPAVYVGQARAELSGLRTDGHEFGLLVGTGSHVTVRGLDSRGAERAGVGFDQSEGELEDVSVLNAGNLGALQLTGSRVKVTRAELKGAVYAGIQVLGGEVALRGIRIHHVTRESEGDGDGLVVHRARVTLDDVRVEGAEGGGLVVGSGAEVEAGALEARFVQHGAVFAGAGASVRIRSIKASGVGDVVLAATEGARVSVQSLEAEDVTQTAYAECASSSRICVARGPGVGKAEAPSACVELGTSDHPVACR